MKRIKLNLALVAMVLGCTLAFAFKAPAPAANTTQVWYWDNVGVVTAESSYTTTPDPCPRGNTHICSILASPDPSNPSEPFIDSGLASRISTKDTSMGDVTLKQ
jgi:hypothetical protein